MGKQKVIAIDGPSASGKGTIAVLVAGKLGFDYLDSGALYRLTALYAQEKSVSWADEPQLADLALNLPVLFQDGQAFLDLGVGYENVESQIRTEEIGLGASAVAKLPLVRNALLDRQRNFFTGKGLVADGRDMGSVVFPEACLKVFLTASAEVRSKRRCLQLERAGIHADYQQILQDIEARDFADQNRVVAPLQKLPDAYLLDSSCLTIEESVKKVLEWFQQIKN